MTHIICILMTLFVVGLAGNGLCPNDYDAAGLSGNCLYTNDYYFYHSDVNHSYPNESHSYLNDCPMGGLRGNQETIT